jgi:pimeloyl-ACP methyl ester carboxylesterase
MRRLRRQLKSGGEIAGIEVGDPIKPFAALWLHATGFNAVTYQSMLAPLGLRARVAALDMRGHGRSTLQAKGGRLPSWTKYRDDVIEWLEQEAPDGLVLGGHSMGGTVALMVAAKRPELVKGLVLADPVILSKKIYFWAHVFPPFKMMMMRNGMAKQASKRRATFPSMANAIERYTGRGAFKTWREPFLSDYLLDGLDRDPSIDPDAEEQRWNLMCTPKWEAATFAAQRNRPWNAMKRVRKAKIPTIILRPERNSVISGKERAKLIQLNPNLIVKSVRGTTHFLPMEAPYAVRDELSSFVARLIEGFSLEEEGSVRRSLKATRLRMV